MKTKSVTGGSRDSKNKLAKVKRYSQIKPAQKSKAKTRKEIRKQERKNKKAKKHAYALSKSKSHQAAGDEEGNSDKIKSAQSPKNLKGKNPKGAGKSTLKDGSSMSQVKIVKKDTASQRRKKEDKDFRHDELKLKKEMEEVRRKRLLEDNLEEDRNISQLEKKLRINKKAIIPASFRTDGLDYLLEICSSSKSKKDKKDKDTDKKKFVDSASEDEEQNYSDDDFSEDFDEDTIDEVKQKVKTNVISKNKKATDEDEDDDQLNSESDIEDDSGDGEDFGDDDDNFEGSELESEGAEEGDENNETVEKKNTNKIKEDFWEDIYGRLRSKDGAVIDEKTLQPKPESAAPAAGGKYIPPGRRENQGVREKITKTLKGLLNRLAESNMHNISQQIEQLYMSNSRNEMNESLLGLFYLSLVPDVAMTERIILEHIMLITVLHANVGSEVGAFFIQNFVQKFRKTYDETESLQDSKALHNLCLLISSCYHFKIVGCGLIFDILNFMAESFKSKDIELILTILRSVGFRLRKDDPLALKNLILLLQERTASNSEHTDSRVKFMLEIIMAIKNNNVSKIPNYDPSYGEHLLKMLKQHFHKGNYVTELKIAMQDLLNADTKGKWWVVGSAWSNEDKASALPTSNENKTSGASQFKVSEKLLAKAKKFGMNTDIRRNIFCIIMTAEDYLDAFEKLMRLGLKNQMEREIIHVTVYCALHEKKYNPFYGLILSKLCTTDRRFMLTLQYSMWDRLKDLTSLTTQQLDNMASLLSYLISGKNLPISVLKIVEFGDMKKEKLTFLKSTLSKVLLQESKESIEDIFSKIALSEKLYIFRESLRLFMGHFMLKPSVSIDGETVTSTFDVQTIDLLEERMAIAERAMNMGRGRVQF